VNCLIVVPSLRRAGAETQAIDLANGLALTGHKTHLMAFDRQLDQLERIHESVVFHHVPRMSKYDLNVVKRLSSILDDENIDVVQSVMQFSTLMAWIAIKRAKSKPALVGAVHTTVNRSLKEELQDRLLYRWLLARLPAVVFVCQAQRDHWVKKYPGLAPPARVIYNGIDTDRFRPDAAAAEARELRARLEISENTPVFSCIAAFRPEKGHDILIRAFSNADPRAVLLLAGAGEMRAGVEDLVRQLALSRRVKFLGQVADSRVVIAASTATVLASTAVETFSMAMLESMAMGVPVVAPRLGGLHEAITHLDTGMLFSVGNEPELTACINEIARNSGLVTTMKARTRERVLRNFTLRQMTMQTEALFRSLAAA
jgi:glycosyltransferase involved in cell wall biosynthesis